MAERAPRLKWHCDGGEWFANAGPLDLNVQQERDFYWWYVESRDESRNGSEVHPAMSLLAAQLAAEDAALAWLSEGVAALGGRVLTGEQVELVIGALENSARHAHEDFASDEAELQLARELGGEHG